MMRQLSNTCGLTVDQEKVWLFVRWFPAANGRRALKKDVRKMFGWSNYNTRDRIDRCVNRRFIKQCDNGELEALEAPHLVVVREVCTLLRIEESDLFSNSKRMTLARARRLITRRLRKANYLFADIARLLGRHPGTVVEYSQHERRLERSLSRSERRRRAKHVEERIAA